MASKKKKRSRARKRGRKKRKASGQKPYTWMFINGKQVRVKRPPTIDGVPVDDFIRHNADPIWLHQNGMWEYLDADDAEEPYLEELSVPQG